MHQEPLRPFISLREATFRLGDRLIFPHTNWIFYRQEHWAVVGGNGSGKSLLADALRGSLPLVHGELQYHFSPPPGFTPEEAIGHVSFEERKHDAQEMVVQSRWNSLEEESSLRVRDFLSYERVMDINPFEVTDHHAQAKPGFERRRRKAVDLLRVGPFLERTLISLSNGETQRVRLARALCHPLRLLLLDEPFQGLDATMRRHFKEVLEQLMDTPLRVLIVTTRPEDLPRQVTHVLQVDQCRVITPGPLRAVLEKHRTPENHHHRPRLAYSTASRSADIPVRSNAGIHHRELVRLQNVTVRYGEALILGNLSWVVRQGESWALLGPNGAGKTTLLSLILGDNLQAFSNEVTVFGIRRGTGESLWDIKKHIGWVSPELHVHFDDRATCLEVVVSGFHESIGLFEPPTARQRASARHWLDRFGLLGFARSPLYGLSAGQQRMVLLARALAKGPKLLILDEPCQGLDRNHRDDFIKVVDRLIREGPVTAIYVTHREDEIPPSIKAVLRLSAGPSLPDKRATDSRK